MILLVNDLLKLQMGTSVDPGLKFKVIIRKECFLRIGESLTILNKMHSNSTHSNLNLSLFDILKVLCRFQVRVLFLRTPHHQILRLHDEFRRLKEKFIALVLDVIKVEKSNKKIILSMMVNAFFNLPLAMFMLKKKRS